MKSAREEKGAACEATRESAGRSRRIGVRIVAGCGDPARFGKLSGRRNSGIYNARGFDTADE